MIQIRQTVVVVGKRESVCVCVEWGGVGVGVEALGRMYTFSIRDFNFRPKRTPPLTQRHRQTDRKTYRKTDRKPLFRL